MKAFVAGSSLLALATADPFYGYAPLRALGGAGLHPTGASYSNRSPQGLGKREAEAFGLGAGGYISQTRPELAPVGLPVIGTFAHPVGKRDADADALYAPVLAKGYPSWPGVVAPGFESTCYGCGLGKREAVEEPKNALATHPNGGTSFVGETVWGFPVAKAVEKREAEPFYGYAPYRALGGAGLHPTGASYSNRSPQGLGKREAEPFYAYGPFRALGGAGLHPTGASYSNRSPQGLGKRDADALGLGAGGFIRQARPYAAFGIHHNGVGAFAHPVGKRDADADALYAAPVLAKGYPSWPGVVAPGFESTCYGCGLGKREAVEEPKNALATHPNGGTSFVGETVWGFPLAKAVEKREADPVLGGAGLHPTGASYSNRSPQGAYGPAPYYWG